MFLHIGRRRGIGGEGGLKRLRRTLANDNGILSGLMFTTVRRGRLAVCGGIDGGIDRVANDEIETVLEADWRGTRPPRWILWNFTFRDRVKALRRDRRSPGGRHRLSALVPIVGAPGLLSTVAASATSSATPGMATTVVPQRTPVPFGVTGSVG